ncbi:unknown [Fusobacterium nucleatum subsp. nucleatum ATCC 25586]|uniref:Uncharacterized protein n=1 Tax=Fusobacterium nucleatum subsp. nucleatum (strain ATCC 25586 / DSM 15643 / BCRC 10681 / CIP 101130 / JCM 8532 / KCTC 2640 / LMG 13131 / VPI 4355) TaxID=190304 RepID=Q8RIC3_FUSNN|nr:unknown [Fusobacterium nucleatum subsp. nucleatum ATCC 25586]
MVYFTIKKRIFKFLILKNSLNYVNCKSKLFYQHYLTNNQKKKVLIFEYLNLDILKILY